MGFGGDWRVKLSAAKWKWDDKNAKKRVVSGREKSTVWEMERRSEEEAMSEEEPKD